MATFDFTITEANVGQTIGPENGFVTRLVRDRAPIHETPTFDEGRQVWTRGYLQLRGSRDIRDLVCFDVANPVFAGDLVVDGNFGFNGGLIAVAVPRGSEWRLTISDTPNVGRRGATAPTAPRAGATFSDFTLTEADVGRALEPRDGYIIDLRMTVPPVHQTPAWHPLRRVYTAGFFVLRGDEDDHLPFAMRNMICYSPTANPLGASIWVNRSEHYRGRLLVESVPRQSVWQLRLSDAPNPRSIAA